MKLLIFRPYPLSLKLALSANLNHCAVYSKQKPVYQYTGTLVHWFLLCPFLGLHPINLFFSNLPPDARGREKMMIIDSLHFTLLGTFH